MNEENLINALKDNIRVEVGFSNDDSLPKLSSNFNLNDSASNQVPVVANKSRYYSIKGSSINDANGRYIYNGKYFGACMYRNVRNWLILRQPLIELPGN